MRTKAEKELTAPQLPHVLPPPVTLAPHLGQEECIAWLCFVFIFLFCFFVAVGLCCLLLGKAWRVWVSLCFLGVGEPEEEVLFDEFWGCERYWDGEEWSVKGGFVNGKGKGVQSAGRGGGEMRG